MFDPELLELMESTIKVAPIGSRGLDGKRTYATDASHKAHVSTKRQLVRNASGEEVLSTGNASLDGAYAEIVESSRLTLPDGRQPKIVAVETTYDSDGPYQTVIYY